MGNKLLEALDRLYAAHAPGLYSLCAVAYTFKRVEKPEGI